MVHCGVLRASRHADWKCPTLPPELIADGARWHAGIDHSHHAGPELDIVSDHRHIGGEMNIDGSSVTMPFFIALPESLMRSVAAEGSLALDGFPCGQANAFSFCTIEQSLHQWHNQVPSIEAGSQENVWIIGFHPSNARFPTTLKNPLAGKGGLLHWHTQSYCGHCLILDTIDDSTIFQLQAAELMTSMVIDARLSLKALLDGLNWDLSGATEQFSFHRHNAIPTRLSKLIRAGRTAGIGSSAMAGSAVQKSIGAGQIGTSEIVVSHGGSKLKVAPNIEQMD